MTQFMCNANRCCSPLENPVCWGETAYLSFFFFFSFLLVLSLITSSIKADACALPVFRREQWLRGRALHSRLGESGFESCAAVLKLWASFFTLHCSSSLKCINEYLAINSGGYVYKQPLCIN